MDKILTTLILIILFFPPTALYATGPEPSESMNQQIYWMPFGDALRYAKENDKIVFVYVYTNWCSQCKKMNDLTFPDPTVQYYLSTKFVCTKINAESEVQHDCNSQRYTEKQIAQMLEVSGYPTMLFLSPNGGSIMGISGYYSPDDIQPVLVYIGEDHYRSMPYRQWRQTQ
jgi:thioredoxin-related protein